MKKLFSNILAIAGVAFFVGCEGSDVKAPHKSSIDREVLKGVSFGEVLKGTNFSAQVISKRIEAVPDSAYGTGRTIVIVVLQKENGFKFAISSMPASKAEIGMVELLEAGKTYRFPSVWEE